MLLLLLLQLLNRCESVVRKRGRLCSGAVPVLRCSVCLSVCVCGAAARAHRVVLAACVVRAARVGLHLAPYILGPWVHLTHLYACMFVCMFVCMCICVPELRAIYPRPMGPSDAPVCMYVCMCVCMCICVPEMSSAHGYILAHLYVCMCVYVCVYVRMYISRR
jgi:hypothetical protein